jgi:NTP pyrophosphatase (non-canonical NTP hydrolase)
MDFNNLLTKLAAINEQLKKHNPVFESDPDKAKLGRMVKLTEEVGELADEVLASQGLQRQEKLDAKQAGDLAKEFGDVFNSLMILGIELGLDVPKAISDRVETMYQKYGIPKSK